MPPPARQGKQGREGLSEPQGLPAWDPGGVGGRRCGRRGKREAGVVGTWGVPLAAVGNGGRERCPELRQSLRCPLWRAAVRGGHREWRPAGERLAARGAAHGRSARTRCAGTGECEAVLLELGQTFTLKVE